MSWGWTLWSDMISGPFGKIIITPDKSDKLFSDLFQWAQEFFLENLLCWVFCLALSSTPHLSPPSQPWKLACMGSLAFQLRLALTSENPRRRLGVRGQEESEFGYKHLILFLQRCQGLAMTLHWRSPCLAEATFSAAPSYRLSNIPSPYPFRPRSSNSPLLLAMRTALSLINIPQAPHPPYRPLLYCFHITLMSESFAFYQDLE